MENLEEAPGQAGRPGPSRVRKIARPQDPKPRKTKPPIGEKQKEGAEVPRQKKRTPRTKNPEPPGLTLPPPASIHEPHLPPSTDDNGHQLNNNCKTCGSSDLGASQNPKRIVSLQHLDLQPNVCQHIGGISVHFRDSHRGEATPPKNSPDFIPQKKSVFLKKINSLCDQDGEFASSKKIESASLVSPYIDAYRKKVYKLKVESESDFDQNISLPTQSIEGRCRCRTSNCLKLYCECFKSLRACHAECACADCHNHENEDTHRVKAMRKVLASKYGKARFQSVSHEGVDSEVGENSQGSNSLAVLRLEDVACQCRKSGCSNKYCGCHSSGKKCGKLCLCLACRNN